MPQPVDREHAKNIVAYERTMLAWRENDWYLTTKSDNAEYWVMENAKSCMDHATRNHDKPRR